MPQGVVYTEGIPDMSAKYIWRMFFWIGTILPVISQQVTLVRSWKQN